MIKELDNDIVFLKNISLKNVIDNLNELNNFQNSINRAMVIVSAFKREIFLHNDLNLIQSKDEGIDYIMFERMQRDLYS
jgi:hypothetical protein